MGESKHRRATIVALASATFLLVLLLSGLNAFRLGFLHPSSTVQILVFSGLSILIFLLFVTLLVLLLPASRRPCGRLRHERPRPALQHRWIIRAAVAMPAVRSTPQLQRRN